MPGTGLLEPFSEYTKTMTNIKIPYLSRKLSLKTVSNKDQFVWWIYEYFTTRKSQLCLVNKDDYLRDCTRSKNCAVMTLKIALIFITIPVNGVTFMSKLRQD